MPVAARASAAATVEARDLSFRHGRQQGVAALSFSVVPGAILGVLGPNGAGKSTLCGLLATLLRPESGALRVLGVDAAHADAGLRRRIGYAGDDPVHFRHLTGTENAEFFARARGLDPTNAQTTVARLLARFGLESDVNRPAGEYSYGMRRKLLLTEALAGWPPLLVLDEPTLGLDPPSREAFAAELRACADRGAAAVVATNDLAAAAAVCDRVVFLHQGRIVEQGSPADLLARLGGATWIDVRLTAPRPPSVAIRDLELVETTTARFRLRSAVGSAVLPALCAALLEQKAHVHAIHIREPDLGDVFSAATGVSWSPAGSSEDDPTPPRTAAR